MHFSLALAGLLATVPTPESAGPEWVWQGDVPALELDLVRADVRVLVARGPTRVRITPIGIDAGAVAFAASPEDGVVRIHDTYPSRGNWPKECLPPVDARGDYWRYVIPMRVTVTVSPGTRLRVRILRGDIHAGSVDAGFDLKTRDGT